jgi:hypothetical protein
MYQSLTQRWRQKLPHTARRKLLIWWSKMHRYLILIAPCIFLLFACIPADNTATENLPPPSTAAWTPNPDYRAGFVWFYKPPEGALLPLLPQHYDFFILTHRDEEQRDTLHALGVTQPIPNYLLLTEIQDPGDCNRKPHGNQVAYLPGDFCNISTNHPDWFLLDILGRRIVDDDNYYNMDPGNPGYRTFWLERALELQRAYGWEGIFLDNVEASLSKYQRNGALPSKYPTDAGLQTAVEGFLAYLSAENVGPLYANIISVADETVWLRYLNYLDGAMLENFAVDWRDSELSTAEWTAEMEMVSTGQRMGKILILVAQGSQDDLARQQFAYASYLLVNEGLSFFRYAHHSAYREVWWYANYEINLGQPLGSTQQRGEMWMREFEHGQVIVNPRKKTAEISLFEAPP